MQPIQHRRRRRRARAEPASGERLVDAAFRRLRLDAGLAEKRAQRAFSLSCGARILAHARAARLSRGVLYVRVASSAWATEISFMKDAILARLRQIQGGERVRDLRFSVGSIEDLPYWEPERSVKERAPSAQVDPRVAAALTQVSDDELRDALGSLYVNACRAGRAGRLTGKP